MMLIGEAFAALGHNTWVSTFCPFFDWKVLRRIAVGHQERLESIDGRRLAQRGAWPRSDVSGDCGELRDPNEWCDAHGQRRQHDVRGFGHLKIIDVSCPQQMLSIMRWIMEGNRGLVYVRVMRTPSAVLYGPDYAFEFGKRHVFGDRRRCR